MECVSIPELNANLMSVVDEFNRPEGRPVEPPDLLFFSNKYCDSTLSPVIPSNSWTLGYITRSPSPPLLQINLAHSTKPHYRKIIPKPSYTTDILGTSEPKKKRQRKKRTCTRCVALSCKECDPSTCNGRQHPSRCHIVKENVPFPLNSVPPSIPTINVDTPTISDTSEQKKKRQRKKRTCTRCVALSCRECNPSTCKGSQNPSQCHIVKK